MELGAEQTIFSLRPNHSKRFRPQEVKELAYRLLVERLENQEYQPDEIQNTNKYLADIIRDRVKDLDFDNYKILVTCLIAENKGGGMRMGSKMLWDSDTDNCVEVSFMNKHLIAVVTIYGIYQY